MIYYELKVASEGRVLEVASAKVKQDVKADDERVVFVLNRYFKVANKSDEFKLYVISCDKNESIILVQSWSEFSVDNAIEKEVKRIASQIWKPEWIGELREIPVKEFVREIENASYEHAFRNSFRVLEMKNKWAYINSDEFKLSEFLGAEVEELNKANIMKRAEELLADASFKDELERILDDEHPNSFMGHPVHYQIKCNSRTCDDMVKILVDALCLKGRLLSRRINKIVDISECCYDVPDFGALLGNAIGGTVVIDMSGRESVDGSFAPSFQQVVDFFAKVIEKYHDKVLFIFVENSEKPGFAKQLTAQVMEYMDLVEIYDGRGGRADAMNYFKHLFEESILRDYSCPDLEELFEEDISYSTTQIRKMFQKWKNDFLKTSVYKSYAKCTVKEKTSSERGEAYNMLSELIGLEAVKTMINQIIATAVVDKSRRKYAGKQFNSSKHMIFTGNPGSCKTTVARILASTLKEEGVLETGEYVECGRADLTAKYVGQTDKKVRALFRRAKGGILFIDEAYSLVERDGLYGDEAINTIVQEMENHRDDVIVIFAGYPHKMEQFLEKNEGLRSRIAFHIDFPDYNADELLLILEKMLKEKQYKATELALTRARGFFEEAILVPDFGNGRFVRNLFEQAMMKQSVRLFEKYRGMEIPEEAIFTLEAEDFEIPNILANRKGIRHIGF